MFADIRLSMDPPHFHDYSASGSTFHAECERLLEALDDAGVDCMTSNWLYQGYISKLEENGGCWIGMDPPRKSETWEEVVGGPGVGHANRRAPAKRASARLPSSSGFGRLDCDVQISPTVRSPDRLMPEESARIR